jgi:glucose 1-dehydrogenase
MGDQVIGMDADVGRVADLERLVARTVEEFGRLDIMVNNAGVETRTSVLDTTEAQYDTVLDVNLKSAFFGTQLAARQMIKQGGGGRIINITSVHEDWPMPGNIAYCLSKGGIRMLTRTAGVELAPHNILVVGLAPGAVATPINRVTMKDPALMHRLDAAIPLGLLGSARSAVRTRDTTAGTSCPALAVQEEPVPRALLDDSQTVLTVLSCRDVIRQLRRREREHLEAYSPSH